MRFAKHLAKSHLETQAEPHKAEPQKNKTRRLGFLRACFSAWIVLVLMLAQGCDRPPGETAATQSSSELGDSESATSRPSESKSVSDEAGTDFESAQPSLTAATWDQVTRLYNQAKQSGQTSADSASQWLLDVWESTTASGADISKQSQEWLSAQYLKAKDAGTTSASSASEYFQSEFSKIGTWEYHVVTRDFGDDTETARGMNQLGSQRWECFAVATQSNQQQMFYRRKVKSDFDNIPTRDLMRILMVVAGGGLLGSGDSQ